MLHFLLEQASAITFCVMQVHYLLCKCLFNANIFAVNHWKVDAFGQYYTNTSGINYFIVAENAIIHFNLHAGAPQLLLLGQSGPRIRRMFVIESAHLFINCTAINHIAVDIAGVQKLISFLS